MKMIASAMASSISALLESRADSKFDKGLHLEARRLYRRALALETWMYEKIDGKRGPNTDRYLRRTERIRELNGKMDNARDLKWAARLR